MKRERKGLLILGIGNLLMGDEGVGVHVIQRLENQSFPEWVELLDGATGSFYLLEPMQEAERVILIDAAAFDDSPGTIRLLRPEYSSQYPRTLTAHDVGLKDLLDSFYLMGEETPDVRLIAITINPDQTLGIGLSSSVAAAAEKAIERVLKEVTIFHNERATVL